MESKRGLSAIVATLLIILLTLVAVGIIWAVIRNVVQGGAEQIDISSKCTAVDVSPTAAACGDVSGNWSCNVTYKRSTTGEAISGLKVILSNGLTSYSQDFPGNVEQAATVTKTDIVTTILSTSTKPNSVQITPYFNDASGTAQLCNPTGDFRNIG